MIPDPRDAGPQIVRLVAVRDQVRPDRALDVPRHAVDAIVADRAAEILGGDVLELMRLVHDCVLTARDDFAVPLCLTPAARAYDCYDDASDAPPRAAASGP